MTAPLRLLTLTAPRRARGLIAAALTAAKGSRVGAAASLASQPSDAPDRATWLNGGHPGRAYNGLLRCIAALGMGAEVARRWPRPSAPKRAKPKKKGKSK